MLWRLVGFLALASLPLASWASEGEDVEKEAGAEAEEEATPLGPKDLPFSPENVLAVVTLHAGELQRCYEEAMARRGSTGQDAPAGRVVIGWTIQIDGLPTQVELRESEIADAAVTNCMLHAIRRWEFPRPDKPQPVEFPFDLEAISGTQTMIGSTE